MAASVLHDLVAECKLQSESKGDQQQHQKYVKRYDIPVNKSAGYRHHTWSKERQSLENVQTMQGKISLGTILNMTLKSKLFVFKLLMSFSLIGQELEAPQNLFYCSQAYSINQLWPISNSYFLGNIKYQSGKYVKNDLILLFNENHLVVDSLVITSGFINNVSIFKDNYFSIATSLKTTDYIIDSDKIVEIKTTPNQGGAKIFSGDMSDVILANYQGLTFGYTTKAKDRTKKRDKKFLLISLLMVGLSIKIFIKIIQ